MFLRNVGIHLPDYTVSSPCLMKMQAEYMFPVKVTIHASDHTVCFLTERYRQQFSRNVGTDSTATHPTRQISTDKVGTHFSLLIFCETSFSRRDSSVIIVTELSTKVPNQCSKPSTGKRYFVSSPHRRDRLCGQPCPHFLNDGFRFPGGNDAWAYHSPPSSSSMITNGWS
jgi:hypothetical protein